MGYTLVQHARVGVAKSGRERRVEEGQGVGVGRVPTQILLGPEKDSLKPTLDRSGGEARAKALRGHTPVF